MTTPPEDFDDDRTGVRDLLRSLPDPGPMPSDVSDRIARALDAEHRSRAQDGPADNVTPLARPQGSSAPGDAARPRSRSQRRLLQAVGGLVAAAAVAAVAVVGINSMHRDRQQTAAVTPHPAATSVSTSQLVDRVTVQSTGTDYRGSTFNAQAAGLGSTERASKVHPSLLARFGDLAKPGGIVGCARSIAGSVLNDPSSIKVDLATYDGKPALIILVTNKGKQTAFAVSTTCSTGSKPYAAPRTV